MARYNFRQGMARRQTDIANNPTFLQKTGQFVTLIVSPDPTIFIIAHQDTDYALIENVTVTNAWGPFTDSTSAWLYWDVDLVTGLLSHQFTRLAPITSATAPSSPLVDQHWFDTANTVMKVYSGTRWIEQVRLFAAEFQNSAIIIPYPLGTQAGLAAPPIGVFAGSIMFDDELKPVQKWTRRRDGEFLTTETPLSGQFARLSNFRVEAAIKQAEAGENVAMHQAVAYTGHNIVSLARNTDPAFPAIGIASEDMITGETRSFLTKGYVQNFVDWNWTEDAGTLIFVGETGQLTTTPPQFNSIQQIAIVVDPQTIYVDTQQIILY